MNRPTKRQRQLERWLNVIDRLLAEMQVVGDPSYGLIVVRARVASALRDEAQVAAGLARIGREESNG